ncbi:MAG: hypothetical protein RR446_00115 [Lachnospiraceae bacterium]
MITSLNVNNFLGQREWKELEGDRRGKERIWEKNKDYFFSYIKNHINKRDDLVILHEVPYVYEVSYLYHGQIKFKRSSEECKIYLQLLEFCRNESLSILTPQSNEKSYFRTIAICFEKIYDNLSCKVSFVECKNRVIILKNNFLGEDMAVVGVHAPSSSGIKEYWESLLLLHHNLKENNYKNIVFIGDFNVYKPGSIQKKMLFSLLAEGMVDLWIEKGYSHTDMTFVKETRIDYAIISDSGYNEFEIFKDDVVRKEGHSDHSAIIVVPIDK